MSNQFINLPVAVGNGVGTPVDVSALGGTKTIVAVGTAKVTLNVEYNNANLSTDGGWQSVATFQNGGSITVQVACKWMRVRSSNFNTTIGGTSAVDVGGITAGTQRVSLPVPAGNGSGTPVDVSALTGPFKTVQVAGPFGGNLIIEVSEDGTSAWAQPFSFNGAPGAQSGVIIAKWMRVSRTGVPNLNPGTPVVNVGFTMVGGGEGLSSIAIGASNSTVSTGTVNFSNGNGVTFGLNGSVMTASVQTAGGTATGVGISAGTQVATTGVVVFSNNHGLTWGLSNGTMTGSYSQSTAPAAISAGTASVGAGTVVFSNSNNVSFGLNGSTVTASANGGAPAVAAGTQTATAGTVVFSNANNVSFGMAGSSQVTASAAVPAISAAGASANAGTVVFSNSNNVSFGMAGSTVTASVSVSAGGGVAISAAGSSISAGTVVFSNANSVSFGMAGSTVTASILPVAPGGAAAWMGDGHDGAATMDGATSVVGCTLSSSTYVATREIFFTDLTVNAGVFFVPNGYPQHGIGTLTNNGNINGNGNDASGGTGGAFTWTGPSHPLGDVGQKGGNRNGGGGGAGGSGGASANCPQEFDATPANGGTTNGQNGTNGGTGHGGGGAAGGGVSGLAGGGGGGVTLMSVNSGWFRNIQCASTSRSYGVGSADWFGTGTGGGAGGDGTGGIGAGIGGGGGGGASWVFLAWNQFAGSGVYEARGGAGAAGADATSAGHGGGGGGGSGGGGVFVIVCSKGTVPTPNVSARPGAAGGNGDFVGGTGGSGGAGLTVLFGPV